MRLGVNDAIAKMESFMQDYPDFNLLLKAISPKGKSKGSLYLVGKIPDVDIPVYEKWDATDSKQAAALDRQASTDQEAQGDAEAIAAGNTVVDVEEKEYETTLSPSGKIAFSGKWNLELQQPIDGKAKDDAGNKWDGQWDENGEFINGFGYKKLGDGAEWRGGFLRGQPAGSGKYKSATITFNGEVETVNKTSQIAPVDGTINQKWESEEVPNKFDSFVGEIANGKRTNGKLTRYKTQSGITSEYIFTGTFLPNEEPKDGNLTKDGKPFATYANGVFTNI